MEIMMIIIIVSITCTLILGAIKNAVQFFIKLFHEAPDATCKAEGVVLAAT